MAVAIDDGEQDRPRPTAVPRLPSGEIDIRQLSGAVADVRCPYCKGNLWAGDGELTCMLCARTPYRLGLSSHNTICLVARDWHPPMLSRAGMGEQARTRRATSREAGRVGLAARILVLIPEWPAYTAISLIRSKLRSRGMTIDNPEIADVLKSLIDAGYVASVSYAGGYRTGYHRTSGAALRAVPQEPS